MNAGAIALMVEALKLVQGPSLRAWAERNAAPLLIVAGERVKRKQVDPHEFAAQILVLGMGL